MRISEKTSYYHADYPPLPSKSCTVTVLDGNRPPYAINLADFKKPTIPFGRAAGNDIVLTSHLVSHMHGQFEYIDGHWMISDQGSTNGLI